MNEAPTTLATNTAAIAGAVTESTPTASAALAEQPAVTAEQLAPAATEPAPAETPAQPHIDTSEYDTASSYTPSFAEGTHIVPGVISEFAPSIKQDTGEFQGWRLIFNLSEEFPDDSGGKLPVGFRVGPLTVFTQESQYRTTDRCVREAIINLQGLNGIVRDKKQDARFAKADAAFRALAPHQKLPGRSDTDPSHYEQWKGTAAKFVITRKGDNINLQSILAYSTPQDAQRR